MEIRDPSRMCRARIPEIPAPQTIDQPRAADAVWNLSLDEAIRIALANAEVIRVVAGNTVASSGETIYGPAIQNTAIDQSRATFDPVLQSNNTFFRDNQPQGVIVNTGPPAEVQIQGRAQNGFQSSTGVAQQLANGATVATNVNVAQDRFYYSGLALNPQTGTNVTMSVTQPLLNGAGVAVNYAPILIARIDTERSFFQMKDSVQQMVLSVILTYWNLSYAQLDCWARRQQVQQGEEALERAQARLDAGLGHEGDVAQARVSLEGFRATLVSSEANLLNQEAVLRNLLGLPPPDERRIVTSTGPITTRLQNDWDWILQLAGQYRPDIIELKLVLEADQQSLLQAKNQALPTLNAGALYRWNGLEGTTPDATHLSASGFPEWEAGINFSVPLGLRLGRATVRQQELTLMQDRANLQQAMHSASHVLAGSYRNLTQYYQQFDAYRRMREAAQLNLQQQMADYLSGRNTLYLTVLQAVTDWGTAVTSEYQALISYNTELARLEQHTGTILETHGVRFVEERYRSIGPLGRWCHGGCYPRDMRPTPNQDRPQPDPDELYRPPEAVQVPTPDSSLEVIPSPRAGSGVPNWPKR